MGAAYTLYKFKELFILVFLIFIVLGVKSQINSVVDEAKKEAIDAVDSTGEVTGLFGVVDSIPDPEAQAKQGVGEWLWDKLENNPEELMLLALLVAGFLFAGGVYLGPVRGFLRGL